MSQPAICILAIVSVIFILSAHAVASWTWDRVTTDCQGGTETVVEYLWSATCRGIAMTTCIDDEGQAYPCPYSIPAPPILFRAFSDPGAGTSVTVADDPVAYPDMLPTPPPGGMCAWPWPSPENPQPVIAKDAADNPSTQACQ